MTIDEYYIMDYFANDNDLELKKPAAEKNTNKTKSKEM